MDPFNNRSEWCQSQFGDLEELLTPRDTDNGDTKDTAK